MPLRLRSRYRNVLVTPGDVVGFLEESVFDENADVIVAEVADARFDIDAVRVEPRKTVAEQDDLVVREKKPAMETLLTS